MLAWQLDESKDLVGIKQGEFSAGPNHQMNEKNTKCARDKELSDADVHTLRCGPDVGSREAESWGAQSSSPQPPPPTH